MDPDTVEDNILLGCEGGSSEDDRSINAELADYLTSNFSLIFTELLVNRDFRNTFMEAVTVEIELTNRDAACVRKVRAIMKNGKGAAVY